MGISISDLTDSIGQWIINYKGEVLGCVKEIIHNEKVPEFMILHCPHLTEDSDRYFAVSLDAFVLKLNRDNKIILKLDKQVLHIVLGIEAENFPDLTRQQAPSVFEIY